MKKLADNLIKHRRSKTTGLSSVGAASTVPAGEKTKMTKKMGRRKSFGGLQLSSALFKSKKTAVVSSSETTDKIASIPSISGVVVETKTKVCLSLVYHRTELNLITFTFSAKKK